MKSIRCQILSMQPCLPRDLQPQVKRAQGEPKGYYNMIPVLASATKDLHFLPKTHRLGIVVL